jgi:glycosyltransferase involved in cell wall biosynthesis
VLGEKAYKIKEQPSNELKLLYQGVVRPGHGIEEIISALHNKIMDKNVTLTILGDINSEYRTLLEDLSIKRGVESRVNFVDRISYAQLPLETRKYDIGLAIHVDNSIQYATGGAASNKIYEYAAMGLPVLLFDREEYRKHLDKYEWAHFTTLSEQSLSSCLSKIVANYTRYSVQAHIDFKEALNYENHFQGVYNNINKGNQI